MQVAAPRHGAAAPRRLSSNIHVGPIQRVGALAGMIGSLLSRWTTQVEAAGFRETIPFRKTDPSGIQQVEAAVQRAVRRVREKR